MQYYCYHINFSSFLTVQCGVALISDPLCTHLFKNQIRIPRQPHVPVRWTTSTNNPRVGQLLQKALSVLKQMCSWTQSNQSSHNLTGSAAFSCLTCTSRSQLEFGSLHNTAAAVAGLQHLIPCLPWRLCSHWQTLLHKVKHGLSGGFLEQGRAGIAVASSLDSGSGSCWYTMRQRPGEQTQE